MLREDAGGLTAYIGAIEVRLSATERLTTSYYFAGAQRIAMREGVTLTYLHGDHLGSASLATDAGGAQVSAMRYTPFGETRYGDAPTDFRFTGQREEGFGLYDYGARFYSPGLGRFVSADVIVPSPGNPQGFNRYAYVGNNPLKYVDPYGFEKVIILYGTDYTEETNSFYAAAYTQYQQALAAGYSEEDILFIEQGITSDTELLDAIRQSAVGEIEHLYYFGHGWGEEGEPNSGVLQISAGREDYKQFISGDIDRTLSNRFAPGADFNIRACRVGLSSLPQTIADAWRITVYASRRSMKFFHLSYAPDGYPHMYPYSGTGDFDPEVRVEMHPYIFGALTVGRLNSNLPAFLHLGGDSDDLVVDASTMYPSAYIRFDPKPLNYYIPLPRQIGPHKMM